MNGVQLQVVGNAGVVTEGTTLLTQKEACAALVWLFSTLISQLTN